MQDKKIKKNIYIDYSIEDTKQYLGNSFPPLIYEYLSKNNNFDLYNLSSKKIPKIDCAIIINGGSHWNYKNLKIKNFHLNQIIIWIYPKIKKIILWLGLIFGLRNLFFYQRHMLRNKSYEKHFDLLLINNPNIKIIHRLDGIYQNICKVYGYDRTVRYLNDKSDITIHQSLYSKNTWEQGVNTIFGKTQTLKSKKTCIISNGVNINLFNPNGQKITLKGKWKILHVSASPNIKKGLYRILELAECLKNNPDFQFYLIGKQNEDPLCGKDIKFFDNVNYLGRINDRKLLAQYYRSCEIFIFPSEDDCSPNVILEAMASGMPILTIDSGGIKELLIKENIQAGVFIDDKNPMMSLNNIISSYDKFKKNALYLSKKYYDFDLSAHKYTSLIQDLTQEK